jgi:hypothetical protein
MFLWMYQEFDFLMYMPKDLAILALDGNRDYLGKEFNLADLNLKQKCFLFYILDTIGILQRILM